MKTISLSLADDLLAASRRHCTDLGVSRAEYLRAAIAEKNKRSEDAMKAERMRLAAALCADADLAANAEFERIAPELPE